MRKPKFQVLLHRLLATLSFLALLSANLSVHAASNGWFYQPAVPKRLIVGDLETEEEMKASVVASPPNHVISRFTNISPPLQWQEDREPSSSYCPLHCNYGLLSGMLEPNRDE